MIGEHDRHVGYLAAMKALHRLAADDLEAKRGDIRPARVIHAYRASTLHTLSDRAKAALARVSPFRKRA